ncbi:RHS repeat domain-containing protein, partial [Flavobacterium psychrophilum]|uniref:RHS repeat domain-containing protein n=3 Tax=Flavobacterium psychrophilum TaxID=96345 RepID=UPI00117BC90E
NGLPEKDVFYYHPDHLGSSSYISTLNGQISQHVEYIAFGEVLFEEHSSSFKSPYLFNGKELDRETNLSFYGARYLDMKTSLWLSVDPLAEEFPDHSPYCFVMNNPLRLTDPTGMAPKDIIDPPGKKTAWRQAYNPRTGNTDIGKFALIKLEQSLEGPARFLNSINTYIKEKVGLSDKNLTTTATAKNGGDENQKTKGKAGEHMDMTGVVESAPGAELPYSKLGNKLELAKSPFEFFESGQKVVEGSKEIKKEVTKKDANSGRSEYIMIRYDPKNSSNNIQIRKDVLEAQQKNNEK